MTKLPRNMLPQIPEDKLDEFISYLKSNDVDVSEKSVKISSLQPIQSHINRTKVDKLKEQFKDKPVTSPILSTSDGFIVDGHHRWIALKEMGKTHIPALVINERLKTVIELCYLFDGVMFKNIHENDMTGEKNKSMKIVENPQLSAFSYPVVEGISEAGIDKIAQSLGIDFNAIDKLEFIKGLKEELEHKDVTKGNMTLTAMIALAHLKELPDYYTRLDKMKEDARKERKPSRMDKLNARIKP